jgi:hypothetical protein
MNAKQMKKWIENELNVLFVGEHGVGKTAMIKEAFEEAGLNWKYFSAATMDPWVDFIGVPKEKVNEDGVSVLELVRPADFAYDNIEALFFDEFNRSPKKIRNAVMELIQFKSINGKKFNNLKIIWAAINPDDEDDTYDVDKLDPAQLDRFHLTVNVPSAPNKQYFKNKHGSVFGGDIIQWYSEQPKDVQDKISPRRLDYIADVLIKDSESLQYVSPSGANNKKLLEIYSKSLLGDEVKVFLSGDRDFKFSYLSNQDNLGKVRSYLGKDSYEKWLPFIEPDQLIGLMAADKSINHFIVNNQSLFNKKDANDDKVADNIVEMAEGLIATTFSSNEDTVYIKELVGGRYETLYYRNPGETNSHKSDSKFGAHHQRCSDQTMRGFANKDLTFSLTPLNGHGVDSFLAILGKTRPSTWKTSIGSAFRKENAFIKNYNKGIASFLSSVSIDQNDADESIRVLRGNTKEHWGVTNVHNLTEYLTEHSRGKVSDIPSFLRIFGGRSNDLEKAMIACGCEIKKI